MDVVGSSQLNEHEKRASRRVWTKEEEEALLGIIDEIVANGGRADCGSFKAGTFKIKEIQLSNILPNYGLRASPYIEPRYWKTTYTPENLAIYVDENSENDVEMLGNFSPMPVNQTDSTQPINQASSQPLSRKRSRSRDPKIWSMNRFTNVLKEAMDKTNETFDKFAQVLANNKKFQFIASILSGTFDG
ncbi:hypothetical protein JRO89_XS11G0161400 [Xanthoceras sorbifolium]|uniref:Myb-like domain-containing protein n=1 Tax=Xanthoceras sorbifolium TaxID=99658 RepID=A0ABQ8HFW2_9ROSI|nr:hypothetical protein JRO89_XS11G0161400 [Xanthoceras sorbifolium]